jgi:protein SCO1/2
MRTAFKQTIGLALTGLMAISFTACNNNAKLPILGPREAVTKTVDGKEVTDTVYKTIPNWSFYNQDSVLINQDAFKDKIYVTDFFFTSCSTICPTMHRNLKNVYEFYKDEPEVAFLSHTIDFKYDVPSKLKSYATKLGVDTKKWQFVWGSKDVVYPLAEKDYLVAVQEDSTATDGYIHQGWLVLVDKDKRLRGAYDGTKPEEVEKLKNDITTLLAEDKK